MAKLFPNICHCGVIGLPSTQRSKNSYLFRQSVHNSGQTKVAGRNLFEISHNVKTLINKVKTLTKSFASCVMLKLWRNLSTNRIARSKNRHQGAPFVKFHTKLVPKGKKRTGTLVSFPKAKTTINIKKHLPSSITVQDSSLKEKKNRNVSIVSKSKNNKKHKKTKKTPYLRHYRLKFVLKEIKRKMKVSIVPESNNNEK